MDMVGISDVAESVGPSFTSPNLMESLLVVVLGDH
jgi:hypothetical protein